MTISLPFSVNVSVNKQTPKHKTNTLPATPTRIKTWVEPKAPPVKWSSKKPNSAICKTLAWKLQEGICWIQQELLCNHRVWQKPTNRFPWQTVPWMRLVVKCVRAKRVDKLILTLGIGFGYRREGFVRVWMEESKGSGGVWEFLGDVWGNFVRTEPLHFFGLNCFSLGTCNQRKGPQDLGTKRWF